MNDLLPLHVLSVISPEPHHLWLPSRYFILSWVCDIITFNVKW